MFEVSDLSERGKKMPINFQSLYLVGGLPLVLVVAFILFLWQTHKDFIRQLDKHSIDRQESYKLFVSEREKSQALFVEALANHCATVQRALERQEDVFADLVSQLKILSEQISHLCKYQPSITPLA